MNTAALKDFAIGSNVILVTLALCTIILASLGMTMFSKIADWGDSKDSTANYDKATKINNFFIACIAIGILSIMIFSGNVGYKLAGTGTTTTKQGLQNSNAMYVFAIFVPVILITLCSLGLEMHGLIKTVGGENVTVTESNQKLVNSLYIAFATFEAIATSILAVAIAFIYKDREAITATKFQGGRYLAKSFFTY